MDPLRSEEVVSPPTTGRRRASVGLALLGSLAITATEPCLAELSINPCQPITHRVVVQPIRAKKSDGSAATFMGDAASQTYIQAQISRIWSQVGITIEWLPLLEFTDDFSYDGSPADYSVAPRPASDYQDIFDGTGASLKDTSGVVVNAFFVGICPGANLAQSATRGLAQVDGNGMCISLAESLMETETGRDTVASVIAHEIGHNLGLRHYLTNPNLWLDPPNLMNPNFSPLFPVGRLIPEQKAILFDPNGGAGFVLLQPYTPIPTYAAWAFSLGVTGAGGHDDDGDGLSNTFEFLQGSCPHTFSAFPTSTPDLAGPVWQLPKQPQAVTAGYRYLVETSSGGLDDWKPAGSPGSGSTVVADATDSLSIRLDYTSGTSGFLRVSVPEPIPN